MPQYKDHPIEECLERALPFIEKGATVYQKWTCARCGERVTANNPNTFTELGHHEEKADGTACGYVTDIRKTGCNWALHMDTSNKALLEEYLKR